MINYKRLIGAGVIGIILSTVPNLYAQTGIESRIQLDRNEKLESTAEKKARELAGLRREREMSELRTNQNNLRYIVHLATTENGVKKPEVFEGIFKKLAISYFKLGEGTIDQKYNFYAEQFEGSIVDNYDVLTQEEINHIDGILMSYFSPIDWKEYLVYKGANENFGP